MDTTAIDGRPAESVPAGVVSREGERKASRWGLGALGWSVAAAVWAALWTSGILPSPFTGSEGFGLGTVFHFHDPRLGHGFTLLLGLAGAGCALLVLRSARRHGGARAVSALAWFLAATTTVVLVHGKLLILLGYMPVVLVLGWRLPGLGSSYLALLGEQETVFLLFCTMGGLVWGMTALAHDRLRRGACGGCGRSGEWPPQRERERRARALRIGRIAVAVAIAAALFYPALRIPWLFGHPAGLDSESWAALQAEPGTVQAGISLGVAALVGAALTLGLVQRWGARFPWWAVGLAGRPVPVPLAVLPAAVVALALVTLGLSTGHALLFASAAPPVEAHWVHILPFLMMPPWGAALGLAAAAYAVRRRAECGSCGRGLPEEAVPRAA